MFSLWPRTGTGSAYKAIHAAIGTVKDFAENEDTMPLNVALEMRFTKHSTSPMSPAYGREVRVAQSITYPDTVHSCAQLSSMGGPRYII